jgi:hypothetical protein
MSGRTRAPSRGEMATWCWRGLCEGMRVRGGGEVTDGGLRVLGGGPLGLYVVGWGQA